MHINTLISEGAIDLVGYIEPNSCNCPACNAQANYRFFDSCTMGCVNQHKAIECPSCGYHSCDDEGCEYCHNRYLNETAAEMADSLGIKDKVSAYFFLADIETGLLALLSKFEFIDSEYSRQAFISNCNDELGEYFGLLYSFSLTAFAKLSLCREINRSVYSILGELTSIVGFEDY